jgi:dienelactone hydrolase
MKHLLTLIFICLTGCALTPEQRLDRNIQTVYAPNSDRVSKTPFVILMQGSGGDLGLSQRWGSWLADLGVSYVMVDSAGLRGIPNLFNVLSYDEDIEIALKRVMNDPKLDITRYALMGFSKGGTAVLQAPRFIEKLPQPKHVFAFYPWHSGMCFHEYKVEVDIKIFYGQLDELANLQGTLRACEELAKKDKRVTYFSFPNAHHRYDDIHEFYRGFRMSPNPAALEETRKIIKETLTKSWGL